MKEFGWTLSQLYEEAERHPGDIAEMLIYISERWKFEKEQMDKASGKHRMGEELHGSKKDIEEWRSHYSAQSKANEAGSLATLKAKFGDNI